MVQRSYVPSRSSHGQMTKGILAAFLRCGADWVVATIRMAHEV
jgi:hypothetical protein